LPRSIEHAISRAMRAALLVLAILIPSLASGATLPLEDGDYTRGRCEGGSDILESIGLYTLTSGPQKGRRFLSPRGENQDGSCVLGEIKASGTRFSGSAKCRDGGTRFEYSSGTYRFAYDVLNNRTFVSKGRKYVWCAPSR